MAGSSHWIIICDKTSAQVTRRIYDDAKELTLDHPAAVCGPNEFSFLYPMTSFLASVVSGATYGYPLEVDPTLMNAVASAAQVSANAVGYAAATAIATETQANINAQIASALAAKQAAASGGASVGDATP